MFRLRRQILAIAFLVIVGIVLVEAFAEGDTTIALVIVLIIGVSLGIFLWLRHWVESD
jgi:hypothetical protein